MTRRSGSNPAPDPHPRPPWCHLGTDCNVLCVQIIHVRGRWGRGGRSGTHLHLKLFGWGPKGREFKSRRPDCGNAGDVRKLIRRDSRAPAAS
jgi:hypothetical protein